jgi:hypothetical protein
MREKLHCLLAAALIAVSGGAHARDALSPDATGLWFDPAQPGWGLEVVQQANTGFAVIFTYDASHKPIWFVAPNLANGIDFNELPAVMQGTLYRTSGPAFSAATFDPHAVGTTAVGNLAYTYPLGGASATTPGRLLSLTYTVDGVQVAKTLQAQTWSQSAKDLAGSYAGQFSFALVNGGDTPPNCPAASSLVSPLQGQPGVFSIGATGSQVSSSWSTNADTTCQMNAAYTRDGQLGGLSGTVGCASTSTAPTVASDPIAVYDIVTGSSGFSGGAFLQHTLQGGGACRYLGSFGGVLREAAARSGMNPDPTGLWFNPNESGWGLILTQQAGNIFAAIFAYGSDGRPAWWVASNVVDTGQSVNLLVGEAFAGTLYGTTGPYLGSADSTALTATAVGNLRVAYVGGTDLLSLSYTVNGVTVDKTLQRETWSSNASQMSGTYSGGLFPSSSACGTSGVFATTPTSFSVTPGTAPDSLRIVWGTGLDTACVIDSTYTQTGQLGSLSGLVQCGPVPNVDTTIGVITLSSITLGQNGFSGFATFTGSNCTAAGFVGGVKTF